MKRLVSITIMAFAIAFASHSQNKPFIDTSRADEIITIGLRAGLNSSTMANNYLDVQPEMIESHFYWRMGSQIGAVADLNFRKYLALSTGIFLENHSFDCSLMAATSQDDYMGSRFIHSRFNYLHIPLMLSFRVNILPGLVGHIDAGGYFALGLFGKKTSHSYIAFGAAEGELIFDKEFVKEDFFKANNRDFLAVKKTDMGLKGGVGFTLFDHYAISVYYQKGLKNIAKYNEGSATYKLHNCQWNVSLGYNF